MDKIRWVWKCRDREFRRGAKPLLMGILNVTPDSFSDGGRFYDGDRAVERGLEMVREGAAILDVGGESSRPGAAPVPADEELARVIPVIKALSRSCQAVLSVDTMKSAVAEQALAAGAHIVNDISALTADPRMADVVRESRAGAILMHMRGEPRTMQEDPRYEDVVREVRDYLRTRVDELTGKGIDRDALAIDPGIGFGKTAEHNVRLLACLGALRNCGRPIVVGLSRKRFLEHLTGRGVGERMAGSLGALAYGLLEGAHVMRVHDVRESRDVIEVMNVLIQEKQTSCSG
ncbi:MAG: dihydropteroate synthase [Verrucomicrobia bacterium]|nr:dihydropteroate synthase [Verrucomicrobiota bacterium]MCG2681508.1 dihydropteroate synthase [Kiritimatiellia bacterium]MBU4248272.1 dihydropteroate synthase [Verrucomicrobiota bacterium]MBU4289888.1 dihydropteroate synthase [Verrucomicrobiota bacterium]MBU4428187.1 dihydropteroate synthase [Verrucomicrobiota bacterium]